MKRLALLLPLIFVIFTACPSQNQGLEVDSGQVTTLLLTMGSGIDDGSFYAAAWRGITAFYGDTPQRTTYRGRFYNDLFVSGQDLVIPTLRDATDEGVSLVITAGFTFEEALWIVAADNPQQYFLMVDTAVELPNVVSAVFAEDEASFLVGAVAALKAVEDGIVNPQFGFIGGMPGPVITRFQLGFIQGVRSVLPDAVVREFYANAWDAPELAYVQALNWFNDGVFAIFSAASTTGNGAIRQAAEMRSMGRNVWAIGVDSDQHDYGLYTATNSAVLTSALKMVEIPVFDTLTAIANGEFRGGEVLVYNLAMNGVDFARTNSALSPAIINRVELLRQQIIDGELVLITNAEQARAMGMLPAFSMAAD